MPSKSVQLRKPHATDVVEKGTTQQYFSRTIAVLSQEELESAETSYLDAMANRGNHKEAKSWYIQLHTTKKYVFAAI